MNSNCSKTSFYWLCSPTPHHIMLCPHHSVSSSIIYFSWVNLAVPTVRLLPQNTSFLCNTVMLYLGFSKGSDSKGPACNAGDMGSIPGSGRSPGEGNGYPLQYSCPENSIDRGAWTATVHEVIKCRTWLSN